MHRAHVDDAAASAGSQHVAHTGARGEERTVEMDGQHVIAGFILLDPNAAHPGLLEQLGRVPPFDLPCLLFRNHPR